MKFKYFQNKRQTCIAKPSFWIQSRRMEAKLKENLRKVRGFVGSWVRKVRQGSGLDVRRAMWAARARWAFSFA
jgi:hypothetical protein